MSKEVSLTDATQWGARTGSHLYCQFRSKSPITKLKIGPRGGMWAFIDGEWKRARKTRAKNP